MGKIKSPSIDVKAIEGVNVCCLTIAKCQNDMSVTKMGKAFLYIKDIINERVFTWSDLYHEPNGIKKSLLFQKKASSELT